MAPRVSLSMPVYNGEEYVALAIRSIIDQEFTDFELIITDNASTDATRRICEQFATVDARIKYYRNECNLGAGVNFNRGFTLSRGEYFKWCAHDDLLSPSYLKYCVEWLDRHPGAMTAYGRLLGIDQAGQPTAHVGWIMPCMHDMNPSRRFSTALKKDGLDAVVFGLHRRRLLERTSLHESYYGSDCALLAEMALLGAFVLVPDAVLYNREHPRRSLRLHHKARVLWQDSSRAGGNSIELSQRLMHLIRIALRHRSVASPLALLGHVLLWAGHPRRLARLGLEALGTASPAAREALRESGVHALRMLRLARP